jgi:hypothetical protein
MHKAYNEGWNAAKTKKLLSDNPYDFGSTDYNQWKKGWWAYSTQDQEFINDCSG